MDVLLSLTSVLTLSLPFLSVRCVFESLELLYLSLSSLMYLVWLRFLCILW